MQTQSHRLLFLVAVLAGLVAWMPEPSLAQRTSATISGTITDPNGGSVPDATVSATAASTGTASKSVTDASGFYVITNLAPGIYSVRVEKAGFQNYVQSGVVLDVDRPVTLNAALAIGSTSQSVTVSAAGSQVDVRSATVSYQVTTKMAVDLPLNGRNVIQLMSLAPDVAPVAIGVASKGPYIQAASRPEDATLLVAADGGRGSSTAFYLDGGLNEDVLTNVANIYPNPDAIQEFSVETNNYSAKFGGRGGGVINAVTRGGTNQFHGAAFEFVRYYPMNGRNFFATSQDGLKRNQYGFTAGGPIQKDKTFIFFSYQGTNLRSLPTGNTSLAPTPAQLSGDFSGLLPKTQVVDPTTQTPFPGNIVPVSRFDPISLKILSYIPPANPATGLVSYTTATVQNGNQYIGRLDHRFGDKFSLYASLATCTTGFHCPPPPSPTTCCRRRPLPTTAANTPR